MPSGIYRHKREILAKNSPFKKGFTPWNKGKECPQISKAKKGKILPKMSIALKGHKHFKETKEKLRRIMSGKYIGEKHPNWQGGKSFELYSPAWTSELRQSIRQRDKYICQNQNCGYYPAFEVHHIDYNKKNCEPENLITLCKSCHRKTNFNRNFWTKELVNLVSVKGRQLIIKFNLIKWLRKKENLKKVLLKPKLGEQKCAD